MRHCAAVVFCYDVAKHRCSAHWCCHYVAVRNPYNNSIRNTRMRRMAHGLTVPVLAQESTHGCFTALRFVQHDRAMSFRAKRGIQCMDASLSMTKATVSFRAKRGIHDIVRHGNSGCFTALRFVQHDRVMSFRAIARNPLWMLHYAYASFSMTRQCHCECQRGIHCALRCASFSMTAHLQDTGA